MFKHKFQTAESFEEEQRQLLAKLNAQADSFLPSPPPVCVERRRKITDPASLPAGRIRSFFDQVTALERGPHEALEKEFKEHLVLRDQAQTALDQLDPETTKPEDYRAAATFRDFYDGKARALGQKLRDVKARLEDARLKLHMATDEYNRRVDELNSIRQLDRPLGPHESIKDRAREVGRAAELEFLLEVLLRPGSPGEAVRAA